jgi:hypothetical protein
MCTSPGGRGHWAIEGADQAGRAEGPRGARPHASPDPAIGSARRMSAVRGARGAQTLRPERRVPTPPRAEGEQRRWHPDEPG